VSKILHEPIRQVKAEARAASHAAEHDEPETHHGRLVGAFRRLFGLDEDDHA